MSSDRPRIFFPNLDSLRFLAFLLVFLQHGFYNGFKAFEGKSYLSDRLISFFFTGGATGVQIFFVLSGFLITYLLLNEQRTAGQIDLKKFYLRRTLRIWPLYYATVIFAFIFYPYLKSIIGINSDLCSRPWYYFTFLANFDSIYISQHCPGQSAMTQGIVWSVAIEEQFYIFWPLLFRLLPSSRQWLIFPLVIAACIGFRIYNADAEGKVLYFHTFAVMGDLAIGGLFAYLCMHNQKFLAWLQQLPKKAIAFAYLFIFFCYFFQDLIFTFPGSVTSSRLIFDCFWAFIIVEQCFARNNLFALGRNEKFSSLGKVSYGLYMLHPIGILITDIAFRLLKINTSSSFILIVMGLISLILSILIARLSYKWFEIPFLRLKDKFAVVKTQVV
ncbi:acyltransferase family protein [Terrimonas pollutisoli]|uniref:acyltransferase family protein n=1 Tax=Terrimonas pollutisoli TaxID=3034147 RepID=UPI0023EE07F3|nr:acyltransferase [Terrimonas sp. H1YJ31]